MKTIKVILQPNANPEATLLAPAGFHDGFERCIDFQVKLGDAIQPVQIDFCEQSAWEISPKTSLKAIELQYRFEPDISPVSETFWQQQFNSYTQPSEALAQDVLAEVEASVDTETRIRQLINLAHQHFQYGHGDGRFYDGEPLVPSVCGTTRGSCVDINTYLLAGAKALDLSAQYIAGYWFHPDKTHTLDMHCWLVFKDGEKVIPWDLAHHMKWGVDTLASGLNPAGGRRVPMSFGRGLKVDTHYGKVSISHFSEPVWVLPDGSTEKSDVIIHIEEEK